MLWHILVIPGRESQAKPWVSLPSQPSYFMSTKPMGDLVSMGKVASEAPKVVL